MTRRTIFKALAAVGLGQKVVSYEPKAGETGFKVVCDSKGNNCHGEGVCGKDHERCPLGHCQKPAERGFLITSIGASERNGRLYIELDDVKLPKQACSVCSTCGIVYVPMELPK